jgi:hypothetical protein
MFALFLGLDFRHRDHYLRRRLSRGYGKGITNDSVFIERVLSNLREFMEADGHSFSYQKFVAPASGTVSFAKTLNRSVTGSLNDLIGHAVAWLEEGDVAPHDLGFRLNDILLSALATSKSDRYGKPNEAFKLLANTHLLSVVRGWSGRIGDGSLNGFLDSHRSNRERCVIHIDD